VRLPLRLHPAPRRRHERGHHPFVHLRIKEWSPRHAVGQFAGEPVAGESYEEVDVRKLLTVAVAVAALSALSVSPAFATGKNPPTSCGVGSAVSGATHEVGGLGKAVHELGGSNVGEVIQPFHEEVKETC
jgi:hypothetical protein